MNSEWPVVPLERLTGDDGRFIGGPFGSSLGRRDYVDEGVPVVRGANLDGLVGDFSDAVYVSEDKAARLARCLASPGDVVVTQRGTLGQVAILDGEYPRYLISQSQMAVHLDRQAADPRFVLYALRSPSVRRQMLNNAIVTGVPHLNLAIFKELLVPKPPLPDQRRVAAVLGALDDKIDSNQRLTDHLRATATALFDDAVRADGMESTVGDWVEFHNKRRRPLSARQRAETPGSVPYYGATGIVDYVAEALFDEPLLLVGEDGSVVRDDGTPVTQYIWGPAWVNNHAHVLIGRGISTELALLAMSRAAVTAWVTGAVQAKLSMGQLRRVPIAIPGQAVRGSLEASIAPLFAHLRRLADEALTLLAVRDALLPKLVSGRIRVPAEDADPVSLVA